MGEQRRRGQRNEKLGTTSGRCILSIIKHGISIQSEITSIIGPELSRGIRNNGGR